MQISFDTITGMAVGLEYAGQVDEDFAHTIILDLFILRFLIQW